MPYKQHPFNRTAPERYAFLHKNGTCFEVSSHKCTAEGVVLLNEEGQPFATVSADEFSAVYPLKPDEILNSKALPERSRIALAMLKVEQAVEEWKDYRAKSGQRIYRLPPAGSIAIFGSASLNITLLPQRVSHDFDIATDDRFWGILRNRMAEMSSDPNDLFISVHTENLMRHSGHWPSRALPIRGLSGLEFLVAHPLDTISQKLLRTDPNVFQSRDIPDIKEILRILHPPSSIISSLLQEGYTRFFDDIPEIAQTARKNTNWFLTTFYPDIDLEKDIIVPGQKQRREGYGNLLPKLAPRDWKELLKNEPMSPGD
ncbi:MAG: hypothetical protein Q7S40_02305 [Opitutaceae bacterium]|nr:hypothetical protein [Opitutaceae bacterium]